MRIFDKRWQPLLLGGAIILILLGWQARLVLPTGGRYVLKSPSHPVKPYTFPAGGRQLLPDYRLVALYGSPGSPVLGALGHQSLPATIARVKKLAQIYQPLSTEPVLPTLEIITTIASAYPTDNHDYSDAVAARVLQPWITAARQAGVYVVLDLQPGRSNFLTQAKQYAGLLAQPNVGLALDPEWRLKAQQVPLVQIGNVDIKEVNSVADWLAQLVRQAHSPQKLFLLHQFRLDMISHRERLDTAHPELAYAIQMDGQGTPGQKHDTWTAITTNAPRGVRFGWKNFYAKDTPTFTPKQTMAIRPQPWYVSYQ